MIFRIKLPPKFFGKVAAALCMLVAYAFKKIEILNGERFKYLAHARHGKEHEAVAVARAVELFAKILHKLPALGCPVLSFFWDRLYVCADVIHPPSIASGRTPQN